jgi:MFS family permease
MNHENVLRARAVRVRVNALPPWQARTIIGAAISLLASGLWWQFVLLRRGPEGVPGAIDPWLARWHGLSSMAALFAFGVIAARHIPRGFALRQRNRSGLTVTALFAVLAVSGYALAYLATDTWHARLGWTHTLLGIIAFALGAVHRR